MADSPTMIEKPIEAEHVENGHDDEKLDYISESLGPSEFDEKRSKALNRRIDRRILPLCCWLYLLNFLDRGNIGNAKVLNQETGDDLLQQTGMTAHEYSIVVSLFSVAYAVFEVPSNWTMKHYVPPNIWLAFLLGAWGALTLGFAGVHNYAAVLSLRFLIGVFEAGFFPGIVYLITIWYRHNERAFRIALVIAFCNLAGAFGGSIAYGLGLANGARGLQGFRWLFIIEGAITLLTVIPTLLILPNYPSRAKWLSESERQFAADRLKERGGGHSREHASRREVFSTIFHPRMWCHYFAYIANVITQGSFTFFAPTIVTGLGFTSIQAQLLTVPPWVVGFIVALLLSYSSDRLDARGWHISAISIVGGAGWLAAGLLPPDAYIKRYICLLIAATGAFPAAPSMTNWVTCNSPSLFTIPLAIALHNSSAGVGQVIAQWIWKPAEAAQGYPTGNFVCAASNFFVAAVTFGLRLWYGRMNKVGALDARGEKRIWAY
ncbi:MFS transporter [Xylariaceae sp. FL0255]|nr:MFS transporter [Xylariaceae sp. FL0255]